MTERRSRQGLAEVEVLFIFAHGPMMRFVVFRVGFGVNEGPRATCKEADRMAERRNRAGVVLERGHFVVDIVFLAGMAGESPDAARSRACSEGFGLHFPISVLLVHREVRAWRR